MNTTLIAIKMTGRTATAAVYIGRELHYTEVRQLTSDLSQAKDSLAGFISSLIQHFRIDSAASPHSAEDTRAQALTLAMLALLREKVIPHWTIDQTQLFEAYSEVPLRKTIQLRDVVRNYWPHIIDERDEGTCLDAAAIGLYIQTERLLTNNSSSQQ
jgi:hypothetical protein